MIRVPLAGCLKNDLAFFLALIGAMKMCCLSLTLYWMGDYCHWIVWEACVYNHLDGVVLNCVERELSEVSGELSNFGSCVHSLHLNEAEFIPIYVN